jgi:two-component system response regulator YesN
MGLSNKEILKAKQFIELNYQNDISLDYLCAYVGLSKSYLSSTFKKVTGENIIDYVIKLRIEKAKQLLRETDLKVFEVAETVGFRDPKYFSKLFKCIEGTSPGKFKEFVGT